MIMLTYGLIDNDKNLELQTLERVGWSRWRKEFVWGGNHAAWKKQPTKACKEAVQLTYGGGSW